VILNPIEPLSLTIDLEKSAGPYADVPAIQALRYDFNELAAVIRGEAKLPTTLDQELIVKEALLPLPDCRFRWPMVRFLKLT
jgi:hypothetical protein